MPRLTLGKVLLTITALSTGIGPYVADWNETHIHNPAWPPHAKFHNAQTMSLGAGLGLSTLGVVWATRGPWSAARLGVATVAASLYWITELSALAYPGTALADPPKEKQKAQIFVASGALALNLVAFLADDRMLRRR